MWFKRPWRWLLEMFASAVLLGLFNLVCKWVDASPFFGLPNVGRLALFVVLTVVLDITVVPTPERLDRNNNPMPPLPDMQRVEAPRPAPRPATPPPPPPPELPQVARLTLQDRQPENDARWQRPKASG